MLGDTAVAVHPDPAAALDEVEAELERATGRGDRQREAGARSATRRTCRAASRRCCRVLIKLRDMAARRAQGEVAAVGSRDSAGGRRVGQARAGQRLREDHPGARSERLRSRPAAEAADDQHPQPRRHAERQRRAVCRADDQARPASAWSPIWRSSAWWKRSRTARSTWPIRDRSKTPIEPYLADQWFVKMDQLAQIGDGRRDRRPGEDHSAALRQGLSRLAGRKARLAGQPAAVVGTSDSDLVLRRRPAKPT